MQHAAQALLQAVDHQAAGAMRSGAGHGAHQVVKLALNGSQVVKNVGVVKLQIVQHGGTGPVVHKLAALVKKGRVVLVGLNHEQGSGVGRRHMRARGVGVSTQAGGNAEIHRHAANQKSGCPSGLFQYPGHHSGGGGLAVGAGDGNHMTPLQHVFGQPLRAAGIRQTRVQNCFHQGKLGLAIRPMHTAHHIADHKQVWPQGQLLGAKTLDQFNAQGAQLVAHRRVDTGVTPRDTVAGFSRQRGQPAHEGATNTENMNVHGQILGGADCRQNGKSCNP